MTTSFLIQPTLSSNVSYSDYPDLSSHLCIALARPFPYPDLSISSTFVQQKTSQAR
ncbi:hypothetical protein PGT21_023152 [Puccinia graminis f. sp. tritici]|uniref:Uncharacterized protein n=1 Tax=Puccinia graminis f. sp. tritici TaxID=56615 RepID=A0A5B0N1E8_PUCGR|nr:hypothetical protein PGT21_023152 [Puccinia graminis f. sp. tritici]